MINPQKSNIAALLTFAKTQAQGSLAKMTGKSAKGYGRWKGLDTYYLVVACILDIDVYALVLYSAKLLGIYATKQYELIVNVRWSVWSSL